MNSYSLTHSALDDKSLYGQDYFVAHQYGLDEKRKIMYAQERKRIYSRVRYGNILDIGCGTGDFLATFDDRWSKWGYEPSEYAAGKAAKKGVEMIRGLHSLDFDCMDVVVLRGVIQHINFPMETLTQAMRVLRHGGLLAILATPNAESLIYQLFGTLPALEAPRNWVVFGHRCLTNILRRLGCEKIEVLHPYLGTPYASPVKDILNFVLSCLAGYRPFAWPGNMMEIYAVKK